MRRVCIAVACAFLKSDTALADGVDVGPGNFAESYSFTPSSTNSSYLFCAYVADDFTATPNATNHATVSTSVPVASMQITESPNPTNHLRAKTPAIGYFSYYEPIHGFSYWKEIVYL